MPIVKISFSKPKLAKICSSAKQLQTNYGKRMADKIQQRLAEILASQNLADLRKIPGARCHELTGNFKGKLAVDLIHPDRLVFSPDHDPRPELPNGGLDSGRVTKIMIEGIGDYH